MKLLLVDDDADLLDLMMYALGREGYSITTAGDGLQALARWQSEQPDLVLLDVNLPLVNGFEVCRRIRQTSDTPVVMLTARRDEADVLHGLRLGADDYVTKPFSARQLAARLQAVLRRYRRDAADLTGRTVHVGELALDLHTQSASMGGALVELTPLEFRLLHLLAARAGQVVPYGLLVRHAWGDDDEGRARLLKTHVSHLRKKLGLPAGSPLTQTDIRAAIGVGYVLSRPVPVAAPDEQWQD